MPLSQHTVTVGITVGGKENNAIKQVNMVINGSAVTSFGPTDIMVPGFDLVQQNWKQLCWWTVGERKNEQPNKHEFPRTTANREIIETVMKTIAVVLPATSASPPRLTLCLFCGTKQTEWYSSRF